VMRVAPWPQIHRPKNCRSPLKYFDDKQTKPMREAFLRLAKRIANRLMRSEQSRPDVTHSASMFAAQDIDLAESSDFHYLENRSLASERH
jgi:hypothetical protein